MAIQHQDLQQAERACSCSYILLSVAFETKSDLINPPGTYCRRVAAPHRVSASTTQEGGIIALEPSSLLTNLSLTQLTQLREGLGAQAHYSTLQI